MNLPLNVKEIEFVGAEDRGYSKDKTGQGNIYNNSAKEFQAAILGKNGKIAGSERKLVREEKNPECYSLEEGKKGYLFETFMSDEELFYVDAKTKIRNMNAKLGIRPTDSAHAYPGDDLVLKFKVKTPYGDCIVKTSEKDYIAVYDKKMLWRANLYIDEGAGDWNNVHPWNAPATSENFTGTWADSNSKSYLAHWNATDWGYNEWNRKYEVDSSTQQLIFGLENGGQVVELPEYSPYRTTGENVINTVSYDYPGEYVNAWDSPFDFIYKMNEQKKSIAKHFTGETNKINNSSLSDEKKKEQLNEAGKFPNGNATISGNIITVSLLSNWGRTTAPNDKWKFYWKQIDSNTNMEPYIPGLGMNIEHKNYKYTGETEAFISTMNFPAKLSAGTDCLGFVKRTSYYRDNGYSWSSKNTMQYDRAEGNLTPDKKGERNSNGLAYPGSYSTQIISREEISNTNSEIGNTKKYYSSKVGSEDGPDISDFNDINNKFMKIVPGDVIYYGSSHIGEIKSVNYNAIENANTIYEIMNAVSVTESVYNGTLFNVTVRTLLQGQPNQTTSTAQAGSWHLDSDSNIRNWQIRRLTK